MLRVKLNVARKVITMYVYWNIIPKELREVNDKNHMWFVSSRKSTQNLLNIWISYSLRFSSYSEICVPPKISSGRAESFINAVSVNTIFISFLNNFSRSSRDNP